MDFGKISLFAAMKGRLGWLNERQRVLAENIANADSPDYRARDLKPLDFKDLLRQRRGVEMEVARTDASHIQGRPDPRGDHRARAERKPYETAPDGNAVVLEEQVMKINETNLQHELTTSLYQKSLQLMKISLGKG